MPNAEKSSSTYSQAAFFITNIISIYSAIEQIFMEAIDNDPELAELEFAMAPMQRHD